MTWIIKAKEDLNKIIDSQCLESYLQTNRKQDGTFYKKHRPYSVPEEALKAIDYRVILSKDIITRDEEEEIKAFLLPFRTFRADEVGII
jgi:hypothetical protein